MSFLLIRCQSKMSPIERYTDLTSRQWRQPQRTARLLFLHLLSMVQQDFGVGRASNDSNFPQANYKDHKCAHGEDKMTTRNEKVSAMPDARAHQALHHSVCARQPPILGEAERRSSLTTERFVARKLLTMDRHLCAPIVGVAGKCFHTMTDTF